MKRNTWIAVSIAAAILILAVPLVLIPRNSDQLKSFSLRHIKGTEAADLLNGFVPPGAVEGWSERAVFVRAGRAELDSVAQILLREDQPKPGISLRFQIIEADGFTAKDTAIAKVEAVLRGLFRFQGYRLLAEPYILARAQSAGTQTVVGSDGNYYEIATTVHDIARRDTKASAELTVVLNVKGFKVLETSVNVPTGQTVVLGTARPDANRGAFILVVTPEIR